MTQFICPIHIGPTKPLVPNHVRHLLLTDLVYKITKFVVADFEYLYNRLNIDVSLSVLRFASYLNDKYSSDPAFYKDKDDLWVGQKYVEYSSCDYKVSNGELLKLRTGAFNALKGYGFYNAVLKTWKSQHDLLNMYDPGFECPYNYKFEEEDVIKLLSEKSLLLDARKLDGGLFLDFTDKGVNLRLLTDGGSNIYNYLVRILCDVLNNAKSRDLVTFCFDDEMLFDYQLLSRVLDKFDIKSNFLITSRISIDGQQLSSRHGGWEPYTLQTVIDKYKGNYSINEIRLGLRLYYLNSFAGKRKGDFSFVYLERALREAKKILVNLDNVDTKNVMDESLKSYLLKSFWVNEHVDIYKLSQYLVSNKLSEEYKTTIIKKFYI